MADDKKRSIWSRYLLPATLSAIMAASLVNVWKTSTVGTKVDRRLAAIEKIVENGHRNQSEWFADLANRTGQIKDRLDNDKLDNADLQDIISSLRGILRALQRILDLGCTLVAEEKKSELKVTLEKLNDELERLSDSPTPTDDQSIRQKISEYALKIRDLVGVIKQLCGFIELGEPVDGSDVGRRTPYNRRRGSEWRVRFGRDPTLAGEDS